MNREREREREREIERDRERKRQISRKQYKYNYMQTNYQILDKWMTRKLRHHCPSNHLNSQRVPPSSISVSRRLDGLSISRSPCDPISLSPRSIQPYLGNNLSLVPTDHDSSASTSVSLYLSLTLSPLPFFLYFALSLSLYISLSLSLFLSLFLSFFPLSLSRLYIKISVYSILSPF